ncbi:MAG: DUF1294 domain-containing protein [Bacteroidales bacterium]|nr:DUF1294 domain-containing protein [Candidatus Physcousia equi]
MENIMSQSLLVLLIALNLVSFITYGIDKWKARHKRWRIPESTLLLLAIVGGSIGAWMGMRVFHHKTLHKKFRYGVPFIILLQLAAVSYFCHQNFI